MKRDLRPCSGSPNCVSSLADRARHRVEPLWVKGDSKAAWTAAVKAVASITRARIVHQEPTYLHAEVRSLLFGFIDDLELVLHPATGRIDVRSASRTGHWDLGVNRARVEHLRRALRQAGVVR